jgi:hypothetical protein
MEWVAGMLWNQWPECRGIGGRNGLEYADFKQEINKITKQ